MNSTDPTRAAPSPPSTAETPSPPSSAARVDTPELHSAEWHAERRKGIGGSDIPVLLGLSKYASPYSLWAEKIGQVPPDESDDEAERFVIAHAMEPVLAR